MTLNQRAVDRKVLVARKPRADRLRDDSCGESLRESVFSKALAIVREHRRHKDILVGTHVEKPAEQQVGLESSTELALGANRVERLQQQRLEQPLRSDRGTLRSSSRPHETRDSSPAALRRPCV